MSNQNHRSVERALEIMELLAASDTALSMNEICKQLNLPKSSAFPVIHTLKNKKYLNTDPVTGKYCIGIKMFEIGRGYLENTDFIQEIKNIVKQLSAEYNETVHFGILDNTEVVYILKEEGNQAIRMASSIGKRMPAHATSLGKALLSGLTDNQIRELYRDKSFEKLTPYTITDLEELIDQIHNVRESSVSFEEQESTQGICCTGVPICDKSGKVVAALSIALPIFRLTKYGLAEYRDSLICSAKKIENILKSVYGLSLF